MYSDTPPTIQRGDLENHPAAIAWTQLEINRRPVELKCLKEARQKTGLGAVVYCLKGVGEAGTDVIGKRSRKTAAAKERIVYEQVLPQLRIQTPQYYGFVDESETEYCWLFVEAMRGDAYKPLKEKHRILAAEFLGCLHIAAANLNIAEDIPEMTADQYLEHLACARDTVRNNFGNSILSVEDQAVLESIVEWFNELENEWMRVRDFCGRMPQTIVHGDCFFSNAVIQSAEGSTPRLVMFDWEAASRDIPAVDLAQFSGVGVMRPDMFTYWMVVRNHWPQLRLRDVQHLATLGTIFRFVAAIRWLSPNLAYEYVEWTIRNMRIYEIALGESVSRLKQSGLSDY